MTTVKRLLALTLALWLNTVTVQAQSHATGWYKIAGGGGASSGGPYAINGTIGQHDASGALNGGNYSLTGGFWSLIAVVPTPGAPSLAITHSGSQTAVSCPVSFTNWTLQTNSTPDTTNWVNYGGTIINNTVTNSPAPGTLFFRLKHQ